MKTIVGYTFTDTITNQLQEAGFPFKKNDSTLKDGYCEFLLPLEANSEGITALELREIIDEQFYVANKNKKNFAPYVHELNKELTKVEDLPNSIYKLGSILDAQNLEESTLKLFLKIRKSHPIWAIELICHDFNKFLSVAKPELFFEWKNKKAALLHFGSGCFDFLVTEP